jgi:hypothetical protein
VADAAAALGIYADFLVDGVLGATVTTAVAIAIGLAVDLVHDDVVFLDIVAIPNDD